MKVLITGAGGQVGRALLRTAPADYAIEALQRAQLNIADHEMLADRIAAAKPTIVINAAAYTAVDRAESDRDGAFAINSLAVSAIAKACLSVNAKLVHISTDYVFDGQSVVAYEPNAATHPVNVYGASKLAGERAIADSHGLRSTIVRTSWVYAPWGANFLLTMLRLMRERESISVVADQIGAPTSALNLAKFLWRAVSASDAPSLLHYTDAGVASWYDFAVAIGEEAMTAGILQRLPKIVPISTAEFPTPAKRPAFSLLSTKTSVATMSFAQPHWRAALREVLKELP